MRLARWIAVAAVVGGATVVISFAGCGGSSSSITNSPDSSMAGDGESSDGASDAPGFDSTKAVCGDGVVEGLEQCDDGSKNGSPGDPCTNGCTWVCSPGEAGACTSGDPCMGAPSCTATHTCVVAAAPEAGTACGTGMICRNMSCSPGVCGDGIVTSPEECDDGSKNGTAGDGCTSACTFVCVSTDPKRDCVPADPCAGQGTCNDMTHVCAAGTPEANGTMCGSNADGGIPDAAAGSICKGGLCVSGQCGDGVVEAGEQCDFGAGNGPGTGCESNCTFSCTLSPNSCVTTDACMGTNTCTAFTQVGDAGSSPGQKCETGMPLGNGVACMIGGTAGTCQSGICKTSNCGNGKVDTGEQCDWGTANNVAGSGCNPDCTFSCTTSPDSCLGSALCSANPEKCTVVQGPSGTPAGDNGQMCVAQTALAECASCGTGVICVNNTCKAHVCGDGCLTAPETCDPPNGTTCDSSCQTIKCGNGILEAAEQCDDGNNTNLDGCDQYCNFEQEQRATTLKISSAATPGISSCKGNALGAKAISSLGLGVIQGDLNTSVANGSTNVMLQFLSASTASPPLPADLSGTTGNVTLGSLSGAPVDADGGTYSGTSDVDWWYTAAANSIDGNRKPLSQIAAAYNSKTLRTLAPGDLSLYLILSGSPANLSMWNASLVASIGPNAPILTSNGTTPPGHLASEHDEALLASTGTGGGTFGTSTAGELCGNVTAQSLKTVPVPTVIAKGGSDACSQGYVVGTNSLLDVLIGGCTFIVPVVNVTQPDQVNSPTLPAGTYTLSASGTSGARVVDTCKQGTTVVPIATCLANVGYSSDFTFATDRVIVK